MKPGSWGSLALIYLYGVASAASLSKVIPLLSHIAALPGANPGSTALFISFLAVAPALLGTVSGALIDRVGARPALIVAALIGVAANTLYQFATTTTEFLAIRLFEGLVPLCVYSAAPALMIASSPLARRSAAMSLWSTYTPVGTSLGLAIGAIFASQEHWQNAFTAHGAVFAALALMGVLLPRSTPAGRVPMRRASPLALLHTREGIGPGRLALTFGILIFLGLGVSVVYPRYLARTEHMSVSQASGILAVVNMVMIVGSVISGILLTKGVRASSLFLGLAIVGTLTGVAIFLPALSLPERITVLVGWLLCTGAAMAVAASLLPSVVSPDHRASAAGLLSQMGAITTFLTPAIWLPALALDQWSFFGLIVLLGWVLGYLLLPTRSYARTPAS